MITTKTSNAALGEQIAKAGETIRRWRTGERFPDSADQARIFEVTGGAVTPNDWVGVGPRTVEDPNDGQVSS